MAQCARIFSPKTAVFSPAKIWSDNKGRPKVIYSQKNKAFVAVHKPDKTFVIGKIDSDLHFSVGDCQASEGIQVHSETPVVIKRKETLSSTIA